MKTLQDMYLDSLELAKKMGYKIAIFMRYNGDGEYEVISKCISGEELDKEIEETKKNGFKREKSEIIDFGVMRVWDNRWVRSKRGVRD